MKKALLTAFTVFAVLLARAQFTVQPGVNKAITINGNPYKIFVPADYATGTNYYFHIAFYGNNNDTHASLDNHEPGIFFLGSNPWDGSVHLNNGSIAKFIVLSIPSVGALPDLYGAAIDSVFKVLGSKVNVNDIKYFSASGFSGGPSRMWDYLNEATSSKKVLFRKTVSISPTIGIDPDPFGDVGRHWVWWGDKDNNLGTPPVAGSNLWSNIGSPDKIKTEQIMPFPHHSGIIWDSCMSVKGLNVSNGGTAATNRWRWLVDSTDGLNPTPPGSAFVIGQLRKKTYSTKEFIYYIPEIADRPTLKYYFVYNVLDSSNKDSAYAVGRGLAKKYRDGWNGKIPLCTGDTAIFVMFTQVNQPDQKATMELGIQLALDSLPGHVFDTAYAQRHRNIFTGLGRGAATQVTYLMNRFAGGQGTAFFRDNFGVLVSLDQHDNGHISTDGAWPEINSPFKSWWWTSNLSGYPYLPQYTRRSKDSAAVRNPGALTKITEVAQSYSPITWDMAYSTTGTTPSDNVFLWIIDTSECQTGPPPGPEGPFVVGQLRKKTYNSRDFLYYVPDIAQRATLKYYFIYNVLDSTNKDSAYAVGRGLAKKYRNGWNGKVPLCTGDTAVFTMVTQIQNPHLKGDMETGIQWALDSLPNHIFDTAYAQRHRNVFTGIGRGVTTQLTYLMNKFVNSQGTSFFRNNFGILVSLDQHDNGHIQSDGWPEIDVPFRSWWWISNLSGYPYHPNYSRLSRDSAALRNPGKATKSTEFAQNYSQVTWDAAYSTTGTSAANNVFMWIVDTTMCEGVGGKGGSITESGTIIIDDPKEIMLSPNPATNMMNIQWRGEGGKANLVIIDMQGRAIHLYQLVSARGTNVYQLNTSMLANGEYLLRLSTGTKVFTKKFLKH